MSSAEHSEGYLSGYDMLDTSEQAYVQAHQAAEKDLVSNLLNINKSRLSTVHDALSSHQSFYNLLVSDSYDLDTGQRLAAWSNLFIVSHLLGRELPSQLEVTSSEEDLGKGRSLTQLTLDPRRMYCLQVGDSSYIRSRMFYRRSLIIANDSLLFSWPQGYRKYHLATDLERPVNTDGTHPDEVWLSYDGQPSGTFLKISPSRQKGKLCQLQTTGVDVGSVGLKNKLITWRVTAK